MVTWKWSGKTSDKYILTKYVLGNKYIYIIWWWINWNTSPEGSHFCLQTEFDQICTLYVKTQINNILLLNFFNIFILRKIHFCEVCRQICRKKLFRKMYLVHQFLWWQIKQMQFYRDKDMSNSAHRVCFYFILNFLFIGWIASLFWNFSKLSFFLWFINVVNRKRDGKWKKNLCTEFDNDFIFKTLYLFFYIS